VKVHWHRLRTPAGALMAVLAVVLFIVGGFMLGSSGRAQTAFASALSILAVLVSSASIQGWKTWGKER